MRKNLLLLTISCLMLVTMGEGLLRWLDVADPPAFEQHADYGYLMQPNQSVSTRGNRFHINRAGFRGEDFAWPKPEGVYRIAFVGDSITYGGGSIPDGDLFVNRVASRLSVLTQKRIEAINLSAPGWGIPNIGAYIENRGLPRIDLLVWVIPAADFRRPMTSLADYHFPNKKPWSRFMYVVSSLTWEVNRRGRQWLAKSNNNTGADHTVRDQNVQAVKHVLANSLEKGNRVVIAFVPSQDENDADRDDLTIFRSAAESLSVPCLDLRPAFEQARLEKVFLDGVHLTSRGHEVVADAIAAFLGKQSLPASKD